jgi:holo-[acyl-carrier protein] synthase
MDANLILTVLSRVSRKRPAEIQGHVSLATLGLTSSFGLSALRSILEAEGRLKLPPLNISMKVNELVGLLSGGTAASVETPARVASPKAPPLRPPARPATATAVPNLARALPENTGLGMDMQEIEDMPVAADFLTHEFYSSHFTPAEIATAVLRPNPRAHLCGIFCAKEAAKKSHSSLLNLRMTDFSVSHDKEGRPLLRLAENVTPELPFQFILSITHTRQFAAATCLTFWGND